MIVCDVRQYPEFSDDSTEFGDDFYHEYYYCMNAELYDGTLMFGTVDHYREVMEQFETWKYVIAVMGGGTVTLYRLWDKYVPDDEDFEPDIECVWDVYDDQSEEDMYAMMEDD